MLVGTCRPVGVRRAPSRSLKRYLERGGQLAPDARSGRIKSLRALGRTQDEAAAIREFIDEHGDDYRADELRTRLGELD